MLDIDRFSVRLNELENEYERGQEQMAFLDQKRADLRDTLLRISGAIQVLKELAAENAATAAAIAPAIAANVESGA
jgi:hypothetical protein